VVEYIPINYGSAVDLVASSRASGQGGGGGGGGRRRWRGRQPRPAVARGTVSADVRTNTLLVSDTRKKIDEIKRMLLVLDRPVDQVLIEARIVIADDTFARDLGARLGISQHQRTDARSPTVRRSAATSRQSSRPSTTRAATRHHQAS
jgi:type IV pilus assembly protein PilQ